MMDIKNLKLRDIIFHAYDHNLSFRLLDLDATEIPLYNEQCKRDHFCIFIIESGDLTIRIEDRIHLLKPGKVAVVFPDQVHQILAFDTQQSVKMLLFDEVLFCSDILQNELTAYNVDLSTRLNCTLLSSDEFQATLRQTVFIAEIYSSPSLIKREQARFHIKILLLGLIETVHGDHPLILHEADRLHYMKFKKMLNTLFMTQRSVKYYAEQLDISVKKLNTITKKHCGKTVIEAIHERLLKEIKRQMLYSEKSHKEIAFDLGFSSPSALHKFVKAKLDTTPSELQHNLEQIYIS